MQRIKLPEHYSSRLLFLQTKTMEDVDEDCNIDDFNLQIRDTTNDVNCTESDNSEYPSKFLLGKLTNHVWYLEDSGIYDSNHEHTAIAYHISECNGTEKTVYQITRIMEYGDECDRLYMEHGGGLKVVLIDSVDPTEEQTLNFYIKYERSKPAPVEVFGNVKDTNNNVIQNCLVFEKYNDNNQLVISEIIQMTFGLLIYKNDEFGPNGEYIPVEYINYCSIHPQNITYDFSKITIKYTIDENTGNEPLFSMIGTNSVGDNVGISNYWGKFISYKYHNDNDSYVEPGYFLVQAPKNRSWICYRTYIGHPNPGVGVYDYSISNYKYKDDAKCINVRWPEAGLNGYYGTYNSSTNTYTYEIDTSEKSFGLLLPKIFWNYTSLKLLDSNGNELVRPDDHSITIIYNELDGMFYKSILMLPTSQVNKIKLEYSAS